MELREKIALAAKTALAQCGSGHYEPFEVMADAILAIPEIRGALTAQIRIKPEVLEAWRIESLKNLKDNPQS